MTENPIKEDALRSSADRSREQLLLSPAVLWRAVRKYWPIALLTTLVVVAATAFQTLSQPRIYQTRAVLQFDPNPPRPLGARVEAVVDMSMGNYWDNQEYYETQYKIIQSMKVALSVVRELGLQHDGAFLSNLPQGKEAPAADVPEEVAAQVLMSRTRVEPIKQSRLAAVTLEDTNPERATRVLNVLIDTYVNQNVDDAMLSTTQAADWLRGQLDKLKTELETSEMSLHEYKKTNNILSLDLDDQSNMLREEMKQLNDALTSVRARKEEIAARHRELSKLDSQDPSDLPASELLQSEILQQLRVLTEHARRERESLIGSGKGMNHPEVQAADARVRSAQAALVTEIKNVQGALQRDLAIAQGHESGLSRLFEAAQARALEVNRLEIDYDRLRRTKDNNEKLYSVVLERTKESDLARMLRVNNIRVLERPLVPTAPIRPRVPRNLMFGLAGGLLLGVVAALVRALLDRSLKTPEDVERDLGIAYLGLLPQTTTEALNAPVYGRKRSNGRVKLTSPGAPELIAHKYPTSGIAEAARAIRTNLVFMAPDKPLRTLLVTSAGPSEGKTTVAACIAIAMAQAGQSVVLIDCDLRRPRIHRVFGKGSMIGMSTAIIDGDIESAIIPTEIPNLSIITAGPIAPNPAELLHSDRFKTLLKQLGQRFDRIIIDSSPVLAVTDAAVLSTQADGTVLVIRAFQTTKDVARHALRTLQDVGANVVGTVLNAVSLDRIEYKYAYYRYKQEGYASDPDAAKLAINTNSPPSPPN